MVVSVVDGFAYNVCITKKTSKDTIFHNKLIPPPTQTPNLLKTPHNSRRRPTPPPTLPPTQNLQPANHHPEKTELINLIILLYALEHTLQRYSTYSLYYK